MITSLSHDEHPHFKQPPPQGLSHGCYDAAVLKHVGNEAKRAHCRRQRDGLDAERTRDVGEQLDVLPPGVTTGSEVL